MPQAALPDVNTAFVTYRRWVLESIRNKNYSSAIGCLYAINAALPDSPKNYQVTISTKQYNNEVKEDMLITCRFCQTQFDYKTIKIKDKILTGFEANLAKSKTDKVWYCNNCKKENRLQQTKIKKTEPKQPYFIGIVPKPPERREGMIDRLTYHNRFTKWAWNFLDELENKMSKYRTEYVPKGVDLEPMEIQPGGEENENLEKYTE